MKLGTVTAYFGVRPFLQQAPTLTTGKDGSQYFQSGFPDTGKKSAFKHFIYQALPVLENLPYIKKNALVTFKRVLSLLWTKAVVLDIETCHIWSSFPLSHTLVAVGTRYAAH